MEVEEIISKFGEDRIREAVESDDPNSLRNLIEGEGITLSDEQLEYIAGGVNTPHRKMRVILPRRRRQGGVTPDTDDPSPYWATDEDGGPNGTAAF